jgi:hypothetical protein
MATAGDWQGVGSFLINLTEPRTDPSLVSFFFILWGTSAFTLACAALMWQWGQRPGRWQGESAHHGWPETSADLRRLMGDPRFLALVTALCFLGGPVFQANNQYLRYRAEDVGLIVGSQDRGWIVLQLIQKLMWIPGGLAVGLLAGRRAPGFAAVLMLAGFALSGAGIGAVSTQLALFAAVVIFEFVRQFMRWSHAGYLSEHMPHDLRATAIGCAISVAGLSSTIFGFAAKSVFDANAPGFDARQPFLLAAVLGLAGAFGLFVFDRFVPIRQAALPRDKGDDSVIPLAAESGSEA